MRKLAGLILLVTLTFQFTGAAGFNTSNMNPQSQIHSAHIGPGTAGLNCDACHGFPANVVQVRNGTKPGEYVVCESCHAPPPDSFKPSMGNLITIHLSRNTYCTNCHDADNISPAHPSTKAENGTPQVIKCENCHANPQQFTSHVDGGKYCLNCYGDKTTTYVVPTRTPLTISVSPTMTPLIIPISTYAASAAKVRIIIDFQRGFVPVVQTIKAGDEIVWKNDGRAAVTLVSSDGLFDNQLLTFDKEYRYTFDKPRIYSFYLDEYKNSKGTVTVSGAESSSAFHYFFQSTTCARRWDCYFTRRKNHNTFGIVGHLFPPLINYPLKIKSFRILFLHGSTFCSSIS